MTDGQIEDVLNILRDKMHKHRSVITTDAAQLVFVIENLAMVMFTSFRECADAMSKMIIRKVSANHDCPPEQLLSALGQKQYCNHDVLATMPRGKGSEIEVLFLKLNIFMNDYEIEKELAKYGLVAASPYDVVAVNKADPAFAGSHPNFSHWKDTNGKWCYLSCYLWGDERRMRVDRRDHGWDSSWWVAGVPK